MTIRQVAELAKLALTPEEESRMEAELQAMLQFAQELHGVDTAGVPMTAHVVHQQNVLRSDEVQPSLDREILLAAAPSRTEACISVPKTFD